MSAKDAILQIHSAPVSGSVAKLMRLACSPSLSQQSSFEIRPQSKQRKANYTSLIPFIVLRLVSSMHILNRSLWQSDCHIKWRRFPHKPVMLGRPQRIHLLSVANRLNPMCLRCRFRRKLFSHPADRHFVSAKKIRGSVSLATITACHFFSQHRKKTYSKQVPTMSFCDLYLFKKILRKQAGHARCSSMISTPRPCGNSFCCLLVRKYRTSIWQSRNQIQIPWMSVSEAYKHELAGICIMFPSKLSDIYNNLSMMFLSICFLACNAQLHSCRGWNFSERSEFRTNTNPLNRHIATYQK